MKNIIFLCIPLVFYITSCKEDADIAQNPPVVVVGDEAEITNVSVSGEENRYSFSVEIKSPDTGCNQYADWWEIISEDEKLLYRRVLAHSHVDEQPFVRSGGPVDIAKNKIVYIRAHMNTNGYGEKVFKGTVEAGFKESILNTSFASVLETQQPLPNGCAF